MVFTGIFLAVRWAADQRAAGWGAKDMGRVNEVRVLWPDAFVT